MPLLYIQLTRGFLRCCLSACLRDCAGRRAGGVLDEVPLLVVDEHRLLLAGSGRSDRDAMVVGRRNALPAVHRQLGLLDDPALAAEDKEGANEHQAEENENQERDQQVDHSRGEPLYLIVIIITND